MSETQSYVLNFNPVKLKIYLNFQYTMAKSIHLSLFQTGHPGGHNSAASPPPFFRTYGNDHFRVSILPLSHGSLLTCLCGGLTLCPDFSSLINLCRAVDFQFVHLLVVSMLMTYILHTIEGNTETPRFISPHPSHCWGTGRERITFWPTWTIFKTLCANQSTTGLNVLRLVPHAFIPAFRR